VERTGELLGLRFHAADHRHRRLVHGEVGVHVDHLARLGLGLVVGAVGRVALLPPELEGAEKELGAKLPADDAVPLIDEHGQVAIRLDPLRVRVTDDRLRRRPHHQRLGQLLAAADRDHRELGREPLDVLLFLLEERLRDEERERGVHVAGGLETSVERRLDVLPQRPAVGLDDHAAADRRVVRQVGAQHELVVPLVEVFPASRQAVRHHTRSRMWTPRTRSTRYISPRSSTKTSLLHTRVEPSGTGGMKWATSRGACGRAMSTMRRPLANQATGISVLVIVSTGWWQPVMSCCGPSPIPSTWKLANGTGFFSSVMSTSHRNAGGPGSSLGTAPSGPRKSAR